MRAGKTGMKREGINVNKRRQGQMMLASTKNIHIHISTAASKY